MTHRFLIHIGYPKSGSSSLQQNVLMHHPDIRYLAGTTLDRDLAGQPEALARAHGFYHALIHDAAPDREALRATWEEVFLPLCDPSRLNVVSDERFVMNYRPPAEIAADLRAIVGPAQILMIARDQVGLLRSQYDMSPFYERDPARRYMDFTPWLREMLDKAEENMIAALRYGDMVDLYAGQFGTENVVVAAFEGLFADADLQAGLAGALGIDAAEFTRLAATSKTGDASTHGFKKITRRILGGRPAGSYLTTGQIRVLRGILRKLFPGKKTEVGAEDISRIRNFFAGHRVCELAARAGITVIQPNRARNG